VLRSRQHPIEESYSQAISEPWRDVGVNVTIDAAQDDLESERTLTLDF
jgi:hypothetical protein